MKAIALIPARLEASRFPRKLLTLIQGKSVLQRTYESAMNSGLFDDVVVVADHDDLILEITRNGGKAVKRQGVYESGTDRIAEIAAHLDADIFVNIQGDEPFVQKEPLQQLLNLFNDPSVQVASLVQELHNNDDINDPNFVKVALSIHKKALLFSRNPIPYRRDQEVPNTYYEHIGVYGFKKEALIQFTQLPMSPLEKVEKIECLRFLENDIPIHMDITNYMGIEIDTPQDIDRAIEFMNKHNLK